MISEKPYLITLSDLRDFIIPLTADESFHLERSLIEEGCRDPLVVWKRSKQELIIVDGHNRFRICRKHNIPFSFNELAFKDVDHVKLWMIENQIGRRNLTQEQLSYYRGLKYLSLRKKKGGFENIKAKGSTEESTATWLSKEFKVSESTIKRNARFAEVLDLIGKADPTLKIKILTGKVKAKRSELNALVEAKDAEELLKLLSKQDQQWRQAAPSTTSFREERLKKIRGMIIGTINRAISNKSASELRELKSLILKFELELLEPTSSSDSLSVSEKSMKGAQMIRR